MADGEWLRGPDVGWRMANGRWRTGGRGYGWPSTISIDVLNIATPGGNCFQLTGETPDIRRLLAERL
jgi:hypothetical protein